MASFFLPTDPFVRRLIQDVFAADWTNPPPAAIYDLIIVGGGPAGMTSIKAATGRQARVPVVEREHFGGECLNVGCVPSKALLRSSRAAAARIASAWAGLKDAAMNHVGGALQPLDLS